MLVTDFSETKQIKCKTFQICWEGGNIFVIFLVYRHTQFYNIKAFSASKHIYLN